ncbi:hypothetical protein LTR85_006275 [Meristemomyces frigidus]|nr:hypothetical protein LTR85_006275 [Meristemomyces frigidus]
MSKGQLKARAEKQEAFLAGKRAAAATDVSSGFGGPDRAPLNGCSSKPSSVHPTGTVDPASQAGSIPAAYDEETSAEAGSIPAVVTIVNSSLGGLDGAPIKAYSSKLGSVHPMGTVVTASPAGSNPAASTGSIPVALTMWQKVDAEERDIWQYLLSHGYKPKDCHNGMFSPCSVEAHTVAALIAVR